MDFRILIFLFSLIFAFLATATRGQPECEAWRNVTDVVRRLDPLNVTCSTHQPCTGFECSGVMVFSEFHENIHFAVSFIPCTDPLQFNIVIDIPNYPSFNQTLNIGKNQVINKTYPLPGLTRKFGQISSEGNVTVMLTSSSSDSNVPLITAEMKVTVKFITQIMSFVKTFVLIPNVTFPVPSCPFHTTPTLSIETDDHLTHSTTPELTGDSCSSFSLEKPCKGKSQLCNENGKCVCLYGYSWNEGAKQCDVPSSNQEAIGPAVIVVAVLSTVIVIAGFAIFLVYKYRRHQDRYGRHTLLINNDNDAELDDPDAPMLTG